MGSALFERLYPNFFRYICVYGTFTITATISVEQPERVLKIL